MEEIIINFVRECPWLYDTTRKDYRDTEKKEDSWKKLANHLNIPEKHVKEKWKNLRSSFVREKKGSAEGKKRPWIFMEKMSFLHPFIKERRVYSNVLDTESDNAEIDSESFVESHDFSNDFFKKEVEEESDVEQPSTSQSQEQELIIPHLTMQYEEPETYTKNKKRKVSYDRLCNSLETTDQALNKMLCHEDKSDDEDEIFTKLIKKKLSTVKCSSKKTNLQIKILQVMQNEIGDD